MNITKKNPHKFNKEIERLRDPERVKRLQLTRVMNYTLAGLKVKEAIDIGTGSALFAEELVKRNISVRAVDQNPEFIEIATGLVKEVEFAIASAEALPYADNSCDLVFMGCVLHEADDLEKAMFEAFRVTRHRLAVLEWPFIDEPIGPELAHRLPLEKIKSLGEKASFRYCDNIQLRVMQLTIFDK